MDSLQCKHGCTYPDVRDGAKHVALTLHSDLDRLARLAGSVGDDGLGGVAAGAGVTTGWHGILIVGTSRAGGYTAGGLVDGCQ